ncbi:MAG: ATP-binding protein [Bacteroidales bacterium]|nr:ATP-binding protein [Bacteroidales bacterium]
METNFPYAQYVTGRNFVGRRSDVTLLGNLLTQGEHVVLSEPPKTGKTSLIQQTLYSLRVKGVTFTVGQFSALNIRTPQDFVLRLGSTLLRMAGTTPAEFADLSRRFLEGTHFVFDPVAYEAEGRVLSLTWDLEAADVAAILSLPFRLAQERGDRIILIIDEFQCLAALDDPDAILRPLSNSLKENRDNRRFSYVFAGSGVNAMKTIFRGSLLFHRLVERVKLSPVDEIEMADHIYRGFTSAGKVVEKELLQGACRLFRGHLWYINHFASICDGMTRGYLMEPGLVDALASLISVHEPRFVDMMSGLTTYQVNLLKATVEGVTRFSSAEVIRQYGLNSSANVKRVKDALMKKEVLEFDEDDKPTIIDPLFEYWVKKYYFEMKEA